MRSRRRQYFGSGFPASILALTLIATGCASWSRKPPQQVAAAPASAPSVASPSATPTQAASAGPVESIQISYAHPNDYLASVSVTKFWAGRVITTRQRQGRTYSIVRFQGGDPVWAIENDASAKGILLGHLPGTGVRADALKSVSYGKLPPGFSQEAPDYGSPEPLEPNKYYVFSVTRGSGATSYQVIRMQADGSVEAYDADPHAGTSYELCCDVPSDFISSSDTYDEPPP